MDDFEISLCILGDALVSDEITGQLGVQPTLHHTKGELVYGIDGTFRRFANTGCWNYTITSNQLRGCEFEDGVAFLLKQLTENLSVWQQIHDQYSISLFCGIFLSKTNQGIVLPPSLLLELAERHIQLELDIYAPGSR